MSLLRALQIQFSFSLSPVTEGTHGDSVYWNIQLDQDLLNTIISIYPEWFKGLKPRGIECNMAQGGSAAGTSSSASVGGCTPSSQMVLYSRSPPKAEVDDSPLQKSMDRNKECKYTDQVQ